MTYVSESPAGWLSPVELTPLRLNELPKAPRGAPWLHGGYPKGRMLEPVRFPQWQ